MKLDSLHAVAASLATADSVDNVLNAIVEGVGSEPNVALARIWLLGPGDRCTTCRARRLCADQSRCLHLEASDGSSLVPGTDRWRNLDGAYSRMPLNAPKIGRVAAVGEPLRLDDMTSGWVVEPDWIAREQIRCVAGQPLIFRGEVMGTLAVFCRERVDDGGMEVLRTFANQAAAAIANARAFEEIRQLKDRLEQENTYLKEEVKASLGFGEIVGDSAAIRHVLAQVDAIAKTDATALILGESGTGKELIAQAIHAKSNRSAKPMVRVNCASIPSELFESEFFGHVKGAFTGATRDRIGRFALADGGTLFLDEVGEIPIDLQGKLLRVLQEGVFESVGESRPTKVDVRVIAATNRDLPRAVEEGAFREDLYYRLNVFPIVVPPLRDRPEDIRAIAEHALQRIARRIGLPVPMLTDEQAAALESYPWPGNVRELQNVLERGVIASNGAQFRTDAGESSKSKPRSSARAHAPYHTYADLQAIERASVLEALKAAAGKVSGKGGAAELLGIKPTTLAYRMKKLGIRNDRVIS